MPRTRVVMTTEQLQKIFDEIMKSSSTPTTPCLTDREVAAYTTEETGKTSGIRSKAEIEAHYESCEDCCDKLSAIFEDFGHYVKFYTDHGLDRRPLFERIMSNLSYTRN